jgi:hypothetical protein
VVKSGARQPGGTCAVAAPRKGQGAGGGGAGARRGVRGGLRGVPSRRNRALAHTHTRTHAAPLCQALPWHTFLRVAAPAAAQRALRPKRRAVRSARACTQRAPREARLRSGEPAKRGQKACQKKTMTSL